ncbi:Myblike DNAbinding domain-containing protein [Dissophora ornata]|nr:Myblike DNAbinding domain-containing protein [Dissophora ornata]
MDDLSDESKNDDVVDNDTLASLLSSQNISTSALSNKTTLPVSTSPASAWPTQGPLGQAHRLPHSISISGDTSTPAPTTVSRPQTSELDASSLTPHDAVPSYTERSVATPLAVVYIEERHEEEGRQSRLHEASSSSTKHHEEVLMRQEGEPPAIDTARLMALMQALQRYKPTGSTSREVSTIPSIAPSSSSTESVSRGRQEVGQSEEGQKDDKTDEDENEHPSADSRSEDESVLLPYIGPEENAQLTSEIREQSTKALSVNRMFQQLLKKQMEEDQLQYLMDRQEATKRAPSIPPTAKAGLGPPHFVDEDLEMPPDNEDTIKREMRPINITGKVRKWTQREREQLKTGVVSENKRLLFDTFLAAKDMAGIQSLSKSSDIQMMHNTKELDWTRISQRFSSEELTKLDELAKKYKERNWVQVALDLDTNRTAAQCFRKYNSKAGKRVSKE